MFKGDKNYYMDVCPTYDETTSAIKQTLVVRRSYSPTCFPTTIVDKENGKKGCFSNNEKVEEAKANSSCTKSNVSTILHIPFSRIRPTYKESKVEKGRKEETIKNEQVSTSCESGDCSNTMTSFTEDYSTHDLMNGIISKMALKEIKKVNQNSLKGSSYENLTPVKTVNQAKIEAGLQRLKRRSPDHDSSQKRTIDNSP
uniref:Uncharacterized protein n=1 Tax=Rhabditophanes sp. KR3021 TaxID=114890 RepID=A0AC35UG48_9BILA